MASRSLLQKLQGESQEGVLKMGKHDSLKQSHIETPFSKSVGQKALPRATPLFYCTGKVIKLNTRKLSLDLG